MLITTTTIHVIHTPWPKQLFTKLDPDPCQPSTAPILLLTPLIPNNLWLRSDTRALMRSGTVTIPATLQVTECSTLWPLSAASTLDPTIQSSTITITLPRPMSSLITHMVPMVALVIISIRAAQSILHLSQMAPLATAHMAKQVHIQWSRPERYRRERGKITNKWIRLKEIILCQNWTWAS